MQDMKEKFKRDTEILESGVKSGIVVGIKSSDSKSDQKIQLTAIHQKDKEGKKICYIVEVKRAPTDAQDKPKRVSFMYQIYTLSCFYYMYNRILKQTLETLENKSS